MSGLSDDELLKILETIDAHFLAKAERWRAEGMESVELIDRHVYERDAYIQNHPLAEGLLRVDAKRYWDAEVKRAQEGIDTSFSLELARRHGMDEQYIRDLARRARDRLAAAEAGRNLYARPSLDEQIEAMVRTEEGSPRSPVRDRRPRAVPDVPAAYRAAVVGLKRDGIKLTWSNTATRIALDAGLASLSEKTLRTWVADHGLPPPWSLPLDDRIASE